MNEPASSEQAMFGGRLGVIAGAGVSLDSPSNLLDGWSFMEHVLRRAPPPDVSSDWVRSGLERPKGRLSRPGEFLRFELAMKALVESGLDDQLSVLECLASCSSPNRNHRMLAALARSGVVVLTTNFDDLIEQAYEELPGAPPLRVAVFDNDFPSSAPGPADGPALWKLHGSFVRDGLDTRASMRATMTSVLSMAQTGRRHRFLAAVLEAMDVLVVGYSGWDDFDIVPVIASTRTDRRITWTMHSESERFDLRDARALRRELDAEWEIDAVGIDRVLLDLDPDGAPVRAPEQVRQLFAPTGKVLEAVCSERAVRAPEPAVSPEPYAFGRRFPKETEAFFDAWAASFPDSAWRRHAFVQSAFELRLEARDARAIKRRVEAGAEPELTAQSTAPDRLRWLLNAFNDLEVTYPPDARQRAFLDRLAGPTAALREELAPHDDVVALRLLGCVGYYLGHVGESDLYFARSAALARREGHANQEIATLLNWRGFWRSRFADGNYARGFASDAAIAFSEEESALSVVGEMSFPVAGTDEYRPFYSYPEEAVDRRIAELEEETGYLPSVARDELQVPLPILLEEFADDLDELVARLRRLRRHAVDVGDVEGEAACSIRLAHVMRAVASRRRDGRPTRTDPTEVVDGTEVPRGLIELVRVAELERLLGHSVEEPLMDGLVPWRDWAAEYPDLERRIRRSMWGGVSPHRRGRALAMANTLRHRVRHLREKRTSRLPWT